MFVFLFTLLAITSSAFGDTYYAFENVYMPEFRRTTQESEVYDSPSEFTDISISNAIRDALNQDTTISEGAKNVLIQVKGGKVTLTGSVRNRDEKREVEFDAQSTRGVKRVYNYLIIQP